MSGSLGPPRAARFLCSVEAFLALAARVTRAVRVRAGLPAPAASDERLDHPVMGSTERDQIVFTWKRCATLRYGGDVMHVKIALALPSQTGENAVSIAFEDARA